jgi:hypothetical protein
MPRMVSGFLTFQIHQDIVLLDEQFRGPAELGSQRLNVCWRSFNFREGSNRSFVQADMDLTLIKRQPENLAELRVFKADTHTQAFQNLRHRLRVLDVTLQLFPFFETRIILELSLEG